MGMLGGNPAIKMEVLVSSFQYGENNSMLVESLEEYVLDYVEYDFEEPGKQAPMRLMTSGGEFHESGNYSNWLDQKHPSFPRPTRLESTNWETAGGCMSVDK